MVYVLPTELYHHGILGQKWGVRRYQNEDGTLTDIGKKRLQKDIIANKQKKKENRIAEEDLKDPDRWVREDISNARDVAQGGKNIIDIGKEIERQTRKEKTTSNSDTASLTDAELRNRINRLQMEKQYRELTAKPASVSKGRKIAQNILEYGGATLGVVSSGLGIALAIQKLKG